MATQDTLIQQQVRESSAHSWMSRRRRPARNATTINLQHLGNVQHPLASDDAIFRQYTFSG